MRGGEERGSWAEGQLAYAVLRRDCAWVPHMLADWCLAEDYAYAQQKSRPEAQQQSLLARALVRRLLYRKTGEKTLSLLREASGRMACAHAQWSYLSLTHSGQFVAAAISVAPVSIDLECWKPRDVRALAAALFPAQLPEIEVEGLPAFYALWTQREARIKLGADADMAQYRTFQHPARRYSLTVGSNRWPVQKD